MAEINLEKIDGCNILITGATGLIGSCIVDELMKNAGCHVYAAGRNLERAKTKFGTYFRVKGSISFSMLKSLWMGMWLLTILFMQQAMLVQISSH